MPRLKKIKLIRYSECRTDLIEIETTVNINAEGMFTTTVDEGVALILEGYGINLATNGRRNGKVGYFQSNTLEGLTKQLTDVMDLALSREVHTKGIVLRYAISTTCSFGLTKSGEIIPNLGWCEDGEIDDDAGWYNGTVNTHATNPKPAGILFYVKPYMKIEYKYRSGAIKTEYAEGSAFGGGSIFIKTAYYGRWLENICSTKPPRTGTIKEIPYTEKNAKFFVKMYKSICTLAFRLKELDNPESVIDMIENNTNLLGTG